jgi:hypothetical protein
LSGREQGKEITWPPLIRGGLEGFKHFELI